MTEASVPKKLDDARKRPTKPGMVRVVVSIPQTVYDVLNEKAIAESAAFPRPVNEILSILIEKNHEALLAD